MHISRLGRFTLCAGVATALLAGCGAPATTASRSGSLPEMRASDFQQGSGSTYKVIKGLLFVANSDPESPYDGVRIYDVRKSHPKPLVNMTNGISQPDAVCIDGDRTLYVLNAGGWVSEYPLGSTSPSKTLTQGIDEPGFCAVDAHSNLWVTNVGGPNVTEYLRGSSVPNKVITDGLTYPVGIAIDHVGNIYVSNNARGSSINVQVYRPGHTAPSRTITNGVKWPVGIGVDTRGTLYVTNLVPGNIEEYRSGSSKPYKTITQEMNGPAAVTFAPSGWMYATNLGTQGGGSGPAPAVLEFPPASQTPVKKMVTDGLYTPIGTAFYPPQLP
jgi:sugar lactone lactonase YvrE